MKELFKLIDGIIRDGHNQHWYLAKFNSIEEAEMYLDDAYEEAHNELYMASWSGRYNQKDLERLAEFFKIDF